MEITTLTTIETERLSALETTIEQGLQTFVEVGNALMEIRDGKLYRATFGTFEDYCRERWGISRPRAYQLMDAAKVFNNLSTVVDKPPIIERQIRPLVGLSSEQQLTVWPLVVDTAPNGKVTAAHVQKTIDEYTQLQREESAQDAHLDAALADESKPACRECGLVYDGPTCPDCNPQIIDATQPFWKDAQIAVYNGDFRSLIETLPDGFIVTDPPYNIGFKYDTYQDNLPESDYIEMISTLKRFKKIAIIQYPEEMQRFIVPALGVPDHTSAWCYNSNTSRRFRLINWYGVTPDYSRIKQPYKNPTDRRVRQLIAEGNAGSSLYEWWDDIQIVKNVSIEKGNHPCPVPEKLMKRIITLGAEAGEIILDPFAGELTTLKAAKDLGYRAVGIELSKSYILGGIERLRQPLLSTYTEG